MLKLPGKYTKRTDADHVFAQLPPLGDPEQADPRFIKAIKKWRPGKGGLVLLGPTGSGKSTALMWLVKLLLARDDIATSTLWVLASELTESPELCERAKRVRYLFLDDLGKEDDYKNRIFQVLERRHIRLPTFISTGLSGEGLDLHYDGAFRRRMFEFRGKRVDHVDVFKPKIKPTKSVALDDPGNPRPFQESS